MRKLYWISLIASSCLLGNENVQIIGSGVDANGSIAHSSGSPVALYQDQILNAEEIQYDRNTSIIEAKGKVNIFKAKQYHMMSDYSRVNLNEETRYSKPYYMFDQSSGSWVSSEEAQGCKNEIDLTSGAVSGCDSTDPLWKIRFSSADYDMEDMWINLYNARLEVENLPVFYLPYFGYPTDRTRRSGLLIPSFGFSGSEGFYYQQPIYFAPQNWWDLEVRPQIRTTRGSGLYADFRFVDTPSSFGTMGVGYFKEKEQYFLENDLANQKHYGYFINYRHTNILNEWFGAGLEGQSGLYVDGLWMNDVDYLNLQHTDETQNVTSNQILSRINGYYNSEDNYFGVYFKHYQYLDKVSNAQTIQTLPTLHYHRYLETFLDDHLLMNGDAMMSNFYRPDGKRALQGDINIPLVLQTSLFDELIDVSYTLNTSAKGIGFYGNPRNSFYDLSNQLIVDDYQYEQGAFAQIDHTFAISSTLLKTYDTLTHVINPFVIYKDVSNQYMDGYYKTFFESEECKYDKTNPACDYYQVNPKKDTLSLGINNYLFAGGKQIVADRLSQEISYDETGSKRGELVNELEWELGDYVSYYNQTAFDHDRNRITKEQNALRYNDGVVSASMNHYYTDDLKGDPVKAVYSSYITADASYRYNRNYLFSGLIAYDYTESLLKRSEVGFLYSTRCLDFGLRYVQNRRPILSTTGNDSRDDSYIFITIILKPIGGSDFNYKLTSN